MEFIFIYGPPAAGKSTVMHELAKITGFRAFENNLTVKLLLQFFPFESKIFDTLSSKIRLILFDAMAKSGTKGLIFTFCYSNPEDNRFVKKVISTVKKSNGKIYFIHLHCNKKELFKRIKHGSRKKLGKFTSTKNLKWFLQKWDFYSKIPFAESLSIDNSKITAKKAAKMIKSYCKL
jgi:hypothetical protein